MTETIEIPKATASSIGKSENAAFGTMKITYSRSAKLQNKAVFCTLR